MSIRILIADDNGFVRAAMRHVLEGSHEQWEIAEAKNGEEAVAKAQELQPNLIIVDLVMPVMDGMTASREIAKVLPETPILMHTLYASREAELEAGRVGVRKLVPKSESRVLVSAVEELLHTQPPSGIPPPASTADKVRATRRTEDRIRDLCAQLLATKDNPANEPLLAELREAVHQHIQNLRARVAGYPAMVERRVRKKVPRPRRPPEKNDTGPVSPGSVASIDMAATEQPQQSPPPKTADE